MIMKLEPTVWIKEGGMFPRPVSTIEDALLVLDQFGGDRGALFYHARVMLDGARDGKVAMSEARQALWMFAQDNDLLAESAAA